MITTIRAFFYYLMLLMYTYMYILFASSTYSVQWTPIHSFYNNMTYYYAHAFFVILKLVGVKIFTNGKIPTNRMLWISNHRSKFDGLLVLILLRLNGVNVISVVKKSISYLPFFNAFAQHADLIFIKRAKADAENVLIEKSRKTLLTNKSILIFPEGTTLSPETKAWSDKYAAEHNLKSFQNVLLPKTAGYEIIQREGKFDKTGNIIIRYDDPAISGIASHSYIDLLKIFPSSIYIDIKDSNESIRPEDLYKVFAEKDKELSQPIVKDNYQLMNNYSVLCLFLNIISFIIFYYVFFTMPSFRYATLAFNIAMSIKALF